MTDETLPAPPVPAEADLRDFPFTPIYRARLFGSAFHARATDAEWRAGVTLWLKSQDQVPPGSLPDDDIELCRLAELGRDLKTWRRIRAGGLHGWYRCSDGRLYHPVVAETVNEQWQGKVDQRLRTLKARIAGLEKRLSQTTEEGARGDIGEQLQKLRQALSQTATAPVTPPVTDPATASKGERKGQYKGEGDSYGGGSKPPDGGPPPPPATGDPPTPPDPEAAPVNAEGGEPDLPGLVEPIPLGMDRTSIGEAVRLWNAMAERIGLPTVMKLTQDRRRKVEARLKDAGGIEGWKAALGKVEASPLLSGRRGGGNGHENWRCTLDFLAKELNFAKIMEGNYDDRQSPGSGGSRRSGAAGLAAFSDQLKQAAAAGGGG